MDRFTDKRVIGISAFLTPLINAGVRKQNKERQLEIKQQLDKLDMLLSKENVEQRSRLFESWFRKIWTEERLQERQIEIRNYFEDNFPVLNKKTTKDNIKVKAELENIIKAENNFGHTAARESLFFGSMNNIMLDQEHDSHTWYLRPTVGLQFSFDAKLAWFYTPKGDLLTEGIRDIIESNPEKSQPIVDNLEKPFIKLPIDIPEVKDVEMPEKVVKFIVDKRQSESAELMGVSVTQFQEAFNRAVNTKQPQTVEERCQIVPIVESYSWNEVENVDVNYLIIKPLFDIV